MTLRATLAALADIIAQEAERNANFRMRLEVALNLGPAEPDLESATVEKTTVESTAGERPIVERTAVGGTSVGNTDKPRKGGRRTPAVLDPVEVARLGEDELRRRLSVLNIEQLRDIVAQYGMDPGKLVMKWKDADRVAERIVELALARSKKGDAFRAD